MLVFLFLLELRFPANKSVAEIIHKIYGSEAVKWLYKFEKLDFKIWKKEANLQFLQSCHQEGLTPKFLNFKLANSSLKHSRTYNVTWCYWKKRLKQKVALFSNRKKDFEIVRNSIKKTVSLFDFAHLSYLFLVGNDGKLVKIKQVHYKKLHALGNFALAPVKFNYWDYLTPFELLFRDIAKLPVSNNIFEWLKVEIKREAFSSYDN